MDALSHGVRPRRGRRGFSFWPVSLFDPRAVSSFSNRRHERKHFFLADLRFCLGPFFCSTAPQAFFCPDRRFPTPTRAEAVTAGRRSAIAAHSAVSRPRLDSFEHGGRLDEHGPEERSVVECGLLWFSLAWIDVAARSTVLYAVQGRWPHHGPQGFDAAMSRTHSTRDRRRKNRAVVEARPSRDSIAPRDAAKGYLDRLRRLENQLQRSIGTSCRWSTCDAG